VKGEFAVADNYGMTRICAAAVSNDDVALFRKDIDDLALAFIAPLQSRNAAIHFS
jgi:hypothetical protein